MKKKNKVISLIVVLSLCFSFTVIPSNAVSPYAVVLPDPDSGGSGAYSGMYYLKNYAYSKYLQIDEDVASSTSLAQMEQWSFDGGSDQKWHFVHLGNEYYKILSIASGLSLSVPSGSSYTADVTLIQEAYTGETRQQWSIDETSRGTVIIRPRSGETDPNAKDWCMASQSNSSNEAKVQQRAYTPNSPYNDEWVIYPVSYSVVKLDVLYDNAYLNRYPSAVSKINGMLATLQEKYLTEFGILIEYSAPAIFTSYGDTCSTNPTQICTHAGDAQCENSTSSTNLKTYHHKNINNILRRVSVPNTSITLKVAFIGHDNCVIINNSHRSNPYYGLAFTSLGYVGVMNFSSSASELKTLVHEFNHLYGVLDHYDSGNAPSTEEIRKQTGNYGYSEYCIHGEEKEDPTVLNNLTICDGCKSILQANRTRYDHH